jgi:hypothetical protein
MPAMAIAHFFDPTLQTAFNGKLLIVPDMVMLSDQK